MRAGYRKVGRIIRGTLDKSDAVAFFFLLIYAMGDVWPQDGPRHVLLIVLALAFVGAVLDAIPLPRRSDAESET